MNIESSVALLAKDRVSRSDLIASPSLLESGHIDGEDISINLLVELLSMHLSVLVGRLDLLGLESLAATTSKELSWRHHIVMIFGFIIREVQVSHHLPLKDALHRTTAFSFITARV